MEHVAPEAIGLWILIFFGILIGTLTIVWLARQLWVSFNRIEVSHDEVYITRKELRDAIHHLEKTITQFVTRTECDAKYLEITKRVDQINEYLHTRLHDLLNSLSGVSMKIDVLSQLLHREIGRREGSKESKGDE